MDTDGHGSSACYDVALDKPRRRLDYPDRRLATRINSQSIPLRFPVLISDDIFSVLFEEIFKEIFKEIFERLPEEASI